MRRSPVFRAVSRIPRAVSDVLLGFVGIKSDLVSDHPDRVRYSSAALMMLIYGTYATAAGATVMSIATGTGTVRWIPLGLGVAFMVMLFDRVVLSHVSADFTKQHDASDALKPMKLGYVLTRVVLALLLAFVVTDSLNEVIFHSEIVDRLNASRVAAVTQSTNTATSAADAVSGKNYRDWQARIGAAKTAMTNAQKNADNLNQIAIDERDGKGPDGQVGCGEKCIEKANAATKAATQAQDATTAYDALVSKPPARVPPAPVKPPALNGLLDRENALWWVLIHRPAALIRFIPLTLLLVALDLAAVAIKFMGRGSAYERSVARAMLIRDHQQQGVDLTRVTLEMGGVQRGLQDADQQAQADEALRRRREAQRVQARRLRLDQRQIRLDAREAGLNDPRRARRHGRRRPAGPPTPPGRGDLLGERWEITGPVRGGAGNGGPGWAQVWLARDTRPGGDPAKRYVAKVVVITSANAGRRSLMRAWAEMDIRSSAIGWRRCGTAVVVTRRCCG